MTAERSLATPVKQGERRAPELSSICHLYRDTQRVSNEEWGCQYDTRELNTVSGVSKMCWEGSGDEEPSH